MLLRFQSIGSSLRTGFAAVGLFVLAMLGSVQPAQSISIPLMGEGDKSAVHPLDPLTWNEHWHALEVLADAGKIDKDTRFARIALAPPDKALVWAWKGGGNVSRRAEIVINQEGRAFEAEVDLARKRLVSFTEIKGAHPPWLMEEYIGPVVAAVKSNPKFIKALEDRGIKRPHFVQCRTSPPGNFDEPKYVGRRIGVVRCFPTEGLRNKYPQRIEGIQIIADMRTAEILTIDDYETVRAVDTIAEYDRAAVGEGRSFGAPISIHQPGGVGFTVNEHQISWDRWNFHVRSDQRVGTVISVATWDDGTRKRPILYEGHLSEISVPYMAPQGDWYLRNPIDAGEYSAGGLSDPLQHGIHCPKGAYFMDGLITNDRGYPNWKKDVICIFERYGGDPSWLHDIDGRPKRELVARMAARLGNYDYLVDWVFSADGQIQVKLGATGIVSIMNTTAKSAANPNNPDGQPADAYGRFVDDHVVAVNHSHYFNVRFDLDVDGPKNTFLHGALKQKLLPQSHVRRSIWVVDEKPILAEGKGRFGGQGHGPPALWRVANTDQRNRVGYPTSYEILAGHSANTLLSPDDFARTRVGFIDHRLWLTAYNPKERFAAGDYPTLSGKGEGLPKYSANNESLNKADLVAWYTMGMHHVVRAEDWPVMPVLWHQVSLRPYDFFDANPAIDLSLEP